MNAPNQNAIRRTERQDLAVVRRQARAAITDQDQVKKLDKMFGPGLGAKKERARLAARIAKGKA